MEVVNHILHQNGKPVTYKLTPNRGGLYTPKYLIIHYDAAGNATAAVNWMLSPKSNVSAHLHITRDGIITQLAPFNIICWHAGKSEWDGLSGLNSHSIGIELQNDGKQDYTELQICVCKAVSDVLVSHYRLKDVLGHSDIAPGRKIDPGPKFPMAMFKVGGAKEKVVKTSTDVNIREGAGVGFKSVGVLKKDTIVEVLEKGEWSKVRVANWGITGYVSNRYLV